MRVALRGDRRVSAVRDDRGQLGVRFGLREDRPNGDGQHQFVRLTERVCKLQTLLNGGLFPSGGHNNTLCPSPAPESTGH